MENPKLEIRNSKQFQISKCQCSKQPLRNALHYLSFEFKNFEFVSNFGIRISNF